MNGHNSSSITVSWILSLRAKSFKQAGFITRFSYIINDTVKHSSLDEQYTFTNLLPQTLYNVVGKLVTNDHVTTPLTNFVFYVSTETKGGKYVCNSVAFYIVKLINVCMHPGIFITISTLVDSYV